MCFDVPSPAAPKKQPCEGHTTHNLESLVLLRVVVGFLSGMARVPKWIKMGLFRPNGPKRTILVHFGLANAKIRFGIRSLRPKWSFGPFWSSTLSDSTAATPYLGEANAHDTIVMIPNYCQELQDSEKEIQLPSEQETSVDVMHRAMSSSK